MSLFQACKFTVKLLGSFAIYAMSFFCGVKGTEMQTFVIYRYGCLPATHTLVPLCPFMRASVSWFLVFHVFCVHNYSQVFPSIVRAITIDVIYFRRWMFACHHDPYEAVSLIQDSIDPHSDASVGVQASRFFVGESFVPVTAFFWAISIVKRSCRWIIAQNFIEKFSRQSVAYGTSVYSAFCHPLFVVKCTTFGKGGVPCPCR